MNQKVLKTLEYNKVIELLEAKANSQPGKQLCRELSPSTDLEEIRRNQSHTADAVSRLFKSGSTSFGSNRDLGYAIKSLEIGSALSIPELLKIAAMLDNVSRIKAYGKRDREDTSEDTLDEYFERLTPLTQLANEINRCILSEEEIADDASPRLKSIRRSMMQTNDKIHTQLSSMLTGSCRSYLQDAVITMRNNRYCIPIKAEYKGQVTGMVHDQSATGSTYFIEPAAVVELNNKLRELELEEKAEIERILADLSAQAGAHTEELADNQKVMTLLDFIFAKAQLAMDMNATEPMFNEEHYIHIRKGRHPLLEKKKVVPIDIHLGRDFDLLIITGPNTGGKTVSLKTVGLFTLMGQAGLHIPAADRSELSIFTEVYADIGDEQSIEQSLSTFSAHMTNIIGILKAADEKSLVLLDELGAGTDPVEGAALATAMIEELRGKGAKLACTTHYAELKAYALQTPGVENGCCEFDVESLRPTYRLLIGVPGKSNAFAISKRLGLEERIVDRAGELVSRESSEFEKVIGRLEEDRRKLQDELELAKKAAGRARDSIREAEAKQFEAGVQARRELEQARKEAADIVARTRRQADALLNELDEARRQKNKALSAEQKARLRSGMRDMESSADPVHRRDPGDYTLPRDLRPGDNVLIFDLDKKATVLEAPRDSQVLVQAGIIKTRVELSNLRLLDEKQKEKPRGRSVTKNVSAPQSGTSLDLRGMSSDEALMEVDGFLDRVSRMSLSQVTIIHGKGTGVLRAAVQKHLRRCPQVKSFRLGAFGEGENGVTIVELK